MNYHRVVIQLLTWGIQLAKLNNDRFDNVVYERAQKSLDFLDACIDNVSGKLPNYGSNDGALFFKLTNDDYRVYSSQLDDLRAVLNGYTYLSSKKVRFGTEFKQKHKKQAELTEITKFKKVDITFYKKEIPKPSFDVEPTRTDLINLIIYILIFGLMVRMCCVITGLINTIQTKN